MLARFIPECLSPRPFTIVLCGGSDRNTLWHCGVYEPGLTRATIHDGQMTETFRKVQGVLFGNHLDTI